MRKAAISATADWMTRQEGALFRRLTRDLNQIAYNHCVRDSTLLQLAIDDVAITFLLVRRAEAHLAHVTDGNRKNAPFSTLEAIAKLRERLRKATREFEDYCRRLGVDKNIGLPDAMQPVLEQIGDTLEQIWEQANDLEDDKA